MNINPQLSIIIPTYNRKEILRKTVGSLTAQTLDSLRYEIIIIDDGSNDGTGESVKEFLEESPVKIRYYRQENCGPATARNVGIEKARGGMVLFIGDDTVADRELLREHLATHNRNPDRDIAVLGYVGWPRDIKVSLFMRYITEETGLQFAYQYIKNPEDVPFNFFYGSNISLKRERLQGGGGFDTSFKYAGFEDIELALRLTQSGLKIIYNRDAVCYHYHNLTLNSFARREYRLGQMAALFWKKHPEYKRFLALGKGVPSDLVLNRFSLRILEWFVKKLESIYYYLDGKEIKSFSKVLSRMIFSIYGPILTRHYLRGARKVLR